jgi:cytochrome P450
MATTYRKTDPHDAPGPRNAPGPRGRPLLGHIRDIQRRPLEFYTSLRRRYGDVVRFRSIFPFRPFLLSHPDDIEYVLRKNARNYPKDAFVNARFKLILGEGLLTSEGELWRRQRRLAQPAFHRRRIPALAGLMTGETEALLEQWNGRPLDVAEAMTRLTLGIVGRALLGTAIDNEEAGALGRAFRVTLAHTNYRSTHLFAIPERFPTPRNRRFLAARRFLDESVYRLIAERRRSEVDGGDLLSMLLLARDEETGEGMSDRQLRDEVVTILVAGYETTATTLAWTWHLLGEHPEAEARLHAELDETLNGRTPTFEDLGSLPYTKMVIQEAMRLYPPAWALVRRAREDDEIRDYRVPAGSTIVLCQYVTHRHPDFWEEPERFDPERFAPERAAGRPPFAYFPFGGGQRLCIGNNLAMMEAQLILATVARRYRLRPVPGHPVEPEPLITLRPRHGVLMTPLDRQ